MTHTEPQLLTPGKIAGAVNVPLLRVLHILATSPHIRPAARAGVLWLYEHKAIAQVPHELSAIDAKRQDWREVRHGR